MRSVLCEVMLFMGCAGIMGRVEHVIESVLPPAELSDDDMETIPILGPKREREGRHKRAKPLALLPLVALIFYDVSGGPFGIEVSPWYKTHAIVADTINRRTVHSQRTFRVHAQHEAIPVDLHAHPSD